MVKLLWTVGNGEGNSISKFSVDNNQPKKLKRRARDGPALEGGERAQPSPSSRAHSCPNMDFGSRGCKVVWCCNLDF